MSGKTDVILPEEAVRQDLADIYIGNLNTVDTDLKLPSRGKRGARFSWKSHETLFISHEGKVTRPTYGVGNRKILLTVSSVYEGGCADRTFEATVLEEPRKASIASLRPVEKTVRPGETAELPPVVIAADDMGIPTTLPVTWEPFTLPASGNTIHIKGHVEETGLIAKARILVADCQEDPGPVRIPVGEVPAGCVRLAEGTRFWDAQERMVRWLLSVDDDQMLYNFRCAAGLDVQGAGPMTGWDAPECNLKGHTTGHYLSGLALAYSVRGQQALKDKISYMVHALSECQKALEAQGCAKGFLSAYSEQQFDLLEVYTKYPEIWAPYYTLDKIMSGLYDCHCLAGSKEAFRLLTGLGDWVYGRLSRLSRAQLDRMWSMYIAGEFGGMISVMVRLYRETGDGKYLRAALFFRNEKLFYPMEENVDTLKDMHANQHIPQAIGALELYEAGGGKRYLDIARNFWQMVVRSHEYSIGGVGETEMFHEPGDIAHYMTDKSAESCASYNLMRLTFGLFRRLPDSRKMDYYENVLYNHILSSASHKADGGTTYFMPVRPGGRKEFNTSENTCCHGTGLESRFRYIRNIYAVGEDGKEVYVNLYIPSELDMADGWKLKLEENGQGHGGQGQDTQGLYTVIFNGLKDGGERTVALRIPCWAREDWDIRVYTVLTEDATADGQVKTDAVTEDSPGFMAESQGLAADSDGYVRIHRQWTPGDRIDISLPFRFRKLPAPDGSCYSSIAFGPYILAALNDSEEYLPCPEVDGWNDRKIQNGFHDGIHGFEADGLKWMPLADVDEERYHIYFVDK